MRYLKIDIINVDSKVNEENNNISAMHIEEAYNNHKDYAAEVIRKSLIYSNSFSKQLIKKGCGKLGITDEDIECFYFGNYMSEEKEGKRILSKLSIDFYKEINNHLK